MSISQEQKKELIKEHQIDKKDTGSPEVQVAIITGRITNLTEHFKIHKKDKHSTVGLIGLVNQRRKLLAYLKSKSEDRYKQLIQKLKLRK